MLSLDQVLDDITLYWLTGTAASSARLYWESIEQVSAWFTSAATDVIAVPTGCMVFPKEVPRPSRRQAAVRFVDIRHWGEPDRGGHFGAWEQPALFVDEVAGDVSRHQSPLTATPADCDPSDRNPPLTEVPAHPARRDPTRAGIECRRRQAWADVVAI